MFILQYNTYIWLLYIFIRQWNTAEWNDIQKQKYAWCAQAPHYESIFICGPRGYTAWKGLTAADQRGTASTRKSACEHAGVRCFLLFWVGSSWVLSLRGRWDCLYKNRLEKTHRLKRSQEKYVELAGGSNLTPGTEHLGSPVSSFL